MRSKRAKIYQQSKELIRELVKLNPLKSKEQRYLVLEKIGYLIHPGVMVLYILSGIYLLTVGFSSYLAAADFWNKAILTTGVITKTTTETGSTTPGSVYAGSSSYTYYVSTVQFQTEQGQIAEFKTNNICQSRQPDLCSGKQVQVLYAFDNPQLSMIKGDYSPLDRAKSKIGCGIFMLLGGVFFFREALSEYNKRFSPTRRPR